VRKIDNRKLKELLLDYYRGAIKEEGSGFKITCPWHDDRNPSCTVFYGSGSFFCFVCHGDKPKGQRGVGVYRGFKALGMPEVKARQLFIQGTGNLQSDTFTIGRAPSLDDPVLPNERYIPPTRPRVEKVKERTAWPADWGFRDLEYTTLIARWFKKRFEPSKVLLANEKIPRIAFAIGGAEAFKDTKNPHYLRHEVYLRISSSTKVKAINSVGLNFDHNVIDPIPATLFGLVNNKLSKGSRGLFLVEGPYDCLHTYQHIYQPEVGGKFDVVALLGTPQWFKVFEQLRAFILPEMARRGIPLILAFDNDAAGHKLTKTAVMDLKSQCYMTDANLKVLNYPVGYKDPGELPFDPFYQYLQKQGLITEDKTKGISKTTC
jgi:hypothetical protein